MHLPAGFLAHLSQRLDEILPVHVVQKNIFSPVAPAHEVIHRPWIFDPQLSWHGTYLNHSRVGMSITNKPFYGLTPFRGRFAAG